MIRMMWKTWTNARAAITALAAFGCVTFAFALSVSDATAATPTKRILAASPALYPSFSWTQRDYVVRCKAAGRPPRLRLNLPGPWRARVGASALRRGKFVAPLRQGPGAGTTVVIRRPGAGTAGFRVRCLPRDFPQFRFKRYRAGGPRLTFAQVGGNYAVFFDRAGAPVWWMKNGIPPLHPQVLRDGTLSWLVQERSLKGRGGANSRRFGWGIRRLDGKLVRYVSGGKNVLTDAHELMLLANGNYLINTFPRDRGLDLEPFGGPSRAVGRGNEVKEITSRGKVVWKWNAGDHIAPAETGRWWKRVLKRRQPLDYLHFNSAEPVGDSMVMSFRHLDAVYEIDRSTGKILWKLGGTPTDERLEVLNDPHGAFPFGGQHDARVDDPGIVSVFDNATDLKRPPRVVRYRIDKEAGTATLISSFGDRQVSESSCCGSARQLPNGQWLVNWGGMGHIRKANIYNLVGAYTPVGRPIFRLWTYGKHMYRAQPITGKYPSLRGLRNAMDSRRPR